MTMDNTESNPIAEIERIVLTEDLPAQRLKAGDIGTVVLVYDDGKGYEVEFCTLAGETIDVVTVDRSQIRSDRDRTRLESAKDELRKLYGRER